MKESVICFLSQDLVSMFSELGRSVKKKNKKKEVVKFEAKEEYFIKNGGILLGKQVALHQGQEIGARQLKIFSLKDIQKATNYFDPDLIVVRTSFGYGFKGYLDNHVVAIVIPTLMKMNPKFDHFLTEISTGMVMSHINVIRLYGCCLETCVPMPVYEFVSGESLFDYLHGNFASKSLNWDDRLRVLTDVSYGLSYMHHALSKPVVHRDVQPQSIILDNSLGAKLGGFLFSVVINPGEKSKKWPVEGTPGYIDPEYIETQEITDKCDVYSFGVLMLEVLTRKQPFMMAKTGADLVDEFVSATQKNCMEKMLDSEILEKEIQDEIDQVAQLALKCVEKKAIRRPTMVEVVCKLREIQSQYM